MPYRPFEKKVARFLIAVFLIFAAKKNALSARNHPSRKGNNDNRTIVFSMPDCQLFADIHRTVVQELYGSHQRFCALHRTADYIPSHPGIRPWV
jgi:hypothetical protein